MSKLSLGSISAAISEHTITTMYNKWSNKNKTHQLKMPSRPFKANSTITTPTKPNTFNLVYLTKQSYSPPPRSSHPRQPHFHWFDAGNHDLRH